MDGEDDLKEELTRRLYSRWNWYFEMTPEEQEAHNAERMVSVEETIELFVHFHFFENFGETSAGKDSLAEEVSEAVKGRKKKRQQEIAALKREIRKTPPERALPKDKRDSRAGRNNRWGTIKTWDELTPEQQAKRIKHRIYMKKYYQKKRLKRLMEE